MTLENNIKKEEGLKLRNAGASYTEIAKALKISRGTAIRWYKNTKKGDSEEGLNDTGIEPPKKERVTGDTENKEKIEDLSDTKNAKITGVTFNKDGSLTIIQDEDAPIKPLVPEPLKGGGGQADKIAPITRKLDPDRPEDMLDGVFTRGMGETLLIGGLIVSGFLLKGKLGEKGEHREERGDAW